MKYTERSLTVAAALLLAACNSTDDGSSVTPSASQTSAAPPFIYSTTDAGPITIELAAPRREEVARVLWVEFESDVPSSADVSVTFRIGIAGEGHVVRAYPFRGNDAVLIAPAEQQVVKTNNVYETATLLASFTQAAGTYQVGLAVGIDGNGIQDVDAIIRDASVNVTVTPQP